MTPVFADTFFFLALLNSKDKTHQEKARAVNRIDKPVVTSAWALLELADHLCDQHNRQVYGKLLAALEVDSRYEIIPAHQTTLDLAANLYRERNDKNWSLTDCTSFVLMRQRNLTEALTADHHFTQAGFTPML